MERSKTSTCRGCWFFASASSSANFAKAAKDTGTYLEINAYPERLDLSDIHCKRAKEAGVLMAIDTDAHSAAGLEVMKYGVMTARRGWVEKKDVINTYPLAKLLKLLYAKRA